MIAHPGVGHTRGVQNLAQQEHHWYSEMIMAQSHMKHSKNNQNHVKTAHGTTSYYCCTNVFFGRSKVHLASKFPTQSVLHKIGPNNVRCEFNTFRVDTRLCKLRNTRYTDFGHCSFFVFCFYFSKGHTFLYLLI